MAQLKEILPVLQHSLRGHFLPTAPTSQPRMLMLPTFLLLLFLRQDFTKLLTLWTRLASNSQQPSCLSLSSAGIMRMWHHICLHTVYAALSFVALIPSSLRLEVRSSSKTVQHSGHSYSRLGSTTPATLPVQSFLLLLVYFSMRQTCICK